MKDKERLERKIKQYKASIFQITFEKDKKNKIKTSKTRKRTKLGKLLEQLIVFEYFKYRVKPDHKLYLSLSSNIKDLMNEYSPKMIHRILKLRDQIIYNMKYNKKPINYTTGSLIRTNQKELGTKVIRLVKDETNKLYQYFYAFDYRDSTDNYKKKTINIPLAYNQTYHGNLKQYSNSLGGNRFKKKVILKSDKKVKVKTQKELIIDEINLLNVEHNISFSKNTHRLNISLTYNSSYTFKEKKKTIGIDIGGGIDNTIATSNDELIGFKHLTKIIEKLNKVETDENLNSNDTETKELKAKKLSKIYRENYACIVNEVNEFLIDCEKNDITDIVMEHLDTFGSLGNKRDKNVDEKFNRLFRLLRMNGLVDIFRMLARNKGIRVHTIPSYYTSKWCNKCNHIHTGNRKGKKFKCQKCGHSGHADNHAADNIVIIFERFSDELCNQANEFGEFSANKYLTKEFIKDLLS